MRIVNRKLYNPQNMCNFIETSVSEMLSVPANYYIRERKEYWLFYFIKDDISAIWQYLYNVDIDQDYLGFPFIKMITRHAIEAFFDLYNLWCDQNYIEVLKYCGHVPAKIPEKYEAFKYNRQYTIQSKCCIAKDNLRRGMHPFGISASVCDELCQIAQQCSNYVHPNVYVTENAAYTNKNITLQELVLKNMFILEQAYQIFLAVFNNGMQPQLRCQCCPYCRNCTICYMNHRNQCAQMISSNNFYAYQNFVPGIHTPYYV